MTSAARTGREVGSVTRFFKLLVAMGALTLGSGTLAQLPNETATPIPSPSIPAGPRPTATVTPLQETPQPTNTVTPLPSTSPGGTQPQTTNTATPLPRASATGTPSAQTTNTVAPSPSPDETPGR